MAFERNTTEGIRTWLTTELSTPGWNSSSIAKGLTEDVMMIIVDDFNLFETKIRQAIILSAMYIRKGDLLSLGDGLNKVLRLALNDKDDFVRTTANVLKDYPDTQSLDLNIDAWSEDFRSLLNNIGSSIKQNGFNFHPLEDMILQPCARTTPPFVSSNYTTLKSTHTKHFSLTTNENDTISSESRHLRFKELVESEERLEQAEAQAAQAVAQKRAGAELQSKSKRIDNLQSPFPFAPANAPPRSYSLGSIPSAAASSLYTKRPARPAPSGGGGLFIKQQKPGQRPVQRQAPGVQRPVPTSSLPRGLQRVQKTRMLDFDAATEFEQNTANALKQAQDGKHKLIILLLI
ncbi:hypothetical protein BDF21DRAFT_13449 [Thamnidium elegans]|nr:hypothetical protein BDF21DRAFT_13449 [Thamnidium elegans]